MSIDEIECWFMDMDRLTSILKKATEIAKTTLNIWRENIRETLLKKNVVGQINNRVAGIPNNRTFSRTFSLP